MRGARCDAVASIGPVVNGREFVVLRPVDCFGAGERSRTLDAEAHASQCDAADGTKTGVKVPAARSEQVAPV